MKLFPKRAQLQEMELKNRDLTGRIDHLHHVQELLVRNILSLQEVEHKYKGNNYQQYDLAVQAISDKYCNLADWGCTQTGAIIDLRAAFILGEGVQVSAVGDKADAENELQWTTDFFTYNGLDAEMSQEIAKEAEIEGKIALNIIWDGKAYDDDPEKAKLWPGMISTRFIPWTTKHYVVTADPTDYLWYKNIQWKSGGAVRTGQLASESNLAPAGNFDEPEFVYKKFGGRLYDPNDAQPKIMKCLTQIDHLDKALWDLRAINHLFASPTPYFECKDSTEVKAFLAELTNLNWKIGKLLAGTAKFTLTSPEAGGVQNLLSEIEMCIKIISGTTGIPIHYLGLLDLLKNRATGDNTRELIMAATAREREIWLGVYHELIQKAMRMFNANAYAQKSTRLDPNKVKVEIPEITQEHWDHIEKVLIPASLGGIVSKEYVASQIPGIDTAEEAQRQQQADASALKAAQDELANMKANAALNQSTNQNTGAVA